MNDLDKVYAENIAKDYMPKEARKIRQLEKLDRKVKTPVFVTALSVGLTGTLVFGLGMCLALGTLGEGMLAMAAGIVIGLLGIGICCVNYPVYIKFLQKRKAKYAYEILELAKEITGEGGI